MTIEEFTAVINNATAQLGHPPPIVVVYLGPSWIITGEWEPLSNQHILVIHIGTQGSPPVYVPLSSIVALSVR